MARYDELLSPSYTEDGEPADSLWEQPADPTATPATSGNAVLHINAGANARPSSPKSIVRWQSPDQFASELALLVNVQNALQATPSNPYAAEGAYIAQGDGGALGAGALLELGGVLRLTYGFGAALRVVEADLQSGSFAIPPCNSLEVSAYLWLKGVADATVYAAIVPGRVQNPARLHNSVRCTLAGGASSAPIHVPWGARWVSLSGGAPVGVVAGGPQVSLVQGVAGPLLLQDWASGVFIGAPGVPVELANRDDLTLTNLAATQATYTVRFYLEP